MEISPEIQKLKIGNEYIERIEKGCKEEFFKFVGIRLDEFLTWDYHSKHICNKISSANFALSSQSWDVSVADLKIRSRSWNDS